MRTGSHQRAGSVALLLAALLLSRTALAESPQAATPPGERPVIALIIDDLGNLRGEGLRALELRGAVTYAFLPHTPHAAGLARLAFLLDKEVMVHIPMESRSGARLGPGGLTVAMSFGEFRNTIRSDVAVVPFARGISNHMGSLLTPRRTQMKWLMKWIREHGGFYFVDSHTVAHSTALQVAHETGIAALKRDVFLDHERDPDFIRHQFRRLIALATQRGSAVGIAHPYPESLAVLGRKLRDLDHHQVELVSVSRLIEIRRQRAAAASMAAAGSP